MVPSLLTAGISEDDAHARATSSMTMHVASASSAGPVVLLGDVRRVELRGAQRVVRRLGELPLVVHLGRVRRDLVRGDLADGVADVAVVLGQLVQVEGRVRGAHLPDITRR